MEVLVQLSRSESLKSRATIFVVILRVGVQKKVFAWGLKAYLADKKPRYALIIYKKKRFDESSRVYNLDFNLEQFDIR